MDLDIIVPGEILIRNLSASKEVWRLEALRIYIYKIAYLTKKPGMVEVMHFE